MMGSQPTGRAARRARSRLRAYGGAVLATAIGYAVEFAGPHVAPSSHFWPYYGAVLAAAWFGGFLPGLFATTLSAVLVLSRFSHSFFAMADLPVAFGIFTSTSVAICLLIAYAQAARHVAEEGDAERARLLASEREARLAAENAQWMARAVIDAASSVVYVKDERGRYVMANEPAAQSLGKPLAEILGRDDRELFSPLAAKQIIERDRQVMATGQAYTEEETIDMNGESRVFWSTKAPYRNPKGDIIGVVGMSRDITDRRHAELGSRFLAESGVLLASSLDYPTTLAAVAHAAVPAFADGCLVHVIDDDGKAHMLEAYFRDPADTAKARDLEKDYPFDPHAPCGPAKVAETGEPEVMSTMGGTALADNRFAALGVQSSLCVPMRARERTLGAITFFSQTSPKRYGAAETALLSEVASRAAIAIDHARMYAIVRRAVEMREEFLSIASHELKTPLTSLQIAVDALSRRAVTRDDGASPRYLALLAGVERSTERLVQLVNDLLDVTRLTSGRLRLTREEVDGAALVRSVVASFGEKLGKAACTVSIHADEPCTGMWDASRLRQIVSHLLANAIKYGGRRPIEISVRCSTNRLLLSVRDHGIGIAAEARERIFGKFERAVPERNYGGFGLGLWIVQQIVSALDGEIFVESEPDSGSTFSVNLPRYPVSDT